MYRHLDSILRAVHRTAVVITSVLSTGNSFWSLKRFVFCAMALSLKRSGFSFADHSKSTPPYGIMSMGQGQSLRCLEQQNRKHWHDLWGHSPHGVLHIPSLTRASVLHQYCQLDSTSRSQMNGHLSSGASPTPIRCGDSGGKFNIVQFLWAVFFLLFHFHRYQTYDLIYDRKYWHQLLRQPLIDFSKTIATVILTPLEIPSRHHRVMTLLLIFSTSGLLHSGADQCYRRYKLTEHRPFLTFFVISTAAIILESFVIRAYQRSISDSSCNRLRAASSVYRAGLSKEMLIGYVWTFLWFVIFSPPMFYPGLRSMAIDRTGWLLE